MTKRVIPQVPLPGNPRREFDAAVKENLEHITGQRTGRIKALDDAASTAEIIAKINEIVARLQE